MFLPQERLVLSILPRFVALEMIADMTSMDDDLDPQQFHKIYIHQYKDVRYLIASNRTCFSNKLYSKDKYMTIPFLRKYYFLEEII